ncbi:MAG: amidohydrolase [Oscillospiraceae bacterium]|jgi:predicted amidohydrolase YtcJ|nr:amidohydrolase [Oscillospiraceae bacterium]
MLLIVHGDIRTMNPAMPRAEAAVVQGGRFAYVGSEAGARTFIGAQAHDTLDAGGGTVLPGFNDAHMHLVNALCGARLVDLTGCGSIAAVQDAFRARLAGHPGGFLVGRGWNQEQFAERRLLTRADLDAVSPAVPLLATRACGHIIAVNSAALALAGVASEDGILRENEMNPIYALVPDLTIAERLHWLKAGQRTLYEKGITSVHSDDMAEDGEAFLTALRGACEDGSIALRYAAQARRDELSALRAFFASGLHRQGSARFRVASIKLMADGSLGACTAWLQSPYADAPDTRGISLYGDDEMTALVAEATANGLPCAVHAIGDAAMEQTLNAFAKAGGGFRQAVVHAQITTAAQVARCGAMGVSILAQPIFLRADVPIVRERAGALADTSYRWRSMLSGGARVAFGTDCPVEPFDPLPGLYYAITRRALPGGAAYLPDEAFTLSEALYAYTAAGAYASGEEGYKGRIAPGMLADFAVLSEKLTEEEPERLLSAKVAHTFIDGQCVFTK